MKRVLTELLNLPEVVVESSLQEGQVLILSVTKKTKSAVCPQCGKKSEHLHQNQNYLIKDLPMGDKEVILNLNRRRFKCKKCRKTFNEQLDFVGARRKYTHRYAENIVKQIINNGVVEGINNKLKLIKRSGFGFRNFRNFEIRALLSWHFAINLAR